jgi:hypothetical protein
MRRTPPAALGICRRLPLVDPTCPRLVPIGPYAAAKRPPGYRGVAAGGAIAHCADERLRGVPTSSGTCRYQTWSLEVGAPAGLPSDAPPGMPGKRLGSGRTRPPQYVHIVIYAARGPLEKKLFPFAWPHGQAQAIGNGLLRPKRRQPISLGSVRWAGLDGELVLAPPLLFGGEVGDHLIFHWKAAGIEHAVSLHSWAPLREAVATLKAVVASAARPTTTDGRTQTRSTTLAHAAIRLRIPRRWQGRIVEFSDVAHPLLILQAASFPLVKGADDLGGATSKLMQRDDIRILLMEFPAVQVGSQGFRPTSFPLRLRSSDFRPVPTSAVSVPHSHALARRHFAAAKRAFSLFVEFGRRPPSPHQLALVQAVLASLSIHSRPELDPRVFARLRRPLHLPRLAPGAPCPRSHVRRAAPKSDSAFPLGAGPVFPNVGSPDGFAGLRGDIVKGGWYFHKTLWAIAPRYRGPVLVRGRQINGSGQVRFGLRIEELRFPAVPAQTRGHWRYTPTSTVLRGAGCFGYQIDGANFSEIVAFRADSRVST